MIEVPAAERGESSQPPPDQAFLQEDTFNIQTISPPAHASLAGQPPH